MDLDDLLEDLWEDVFDDARRRAGTAAEQLRRKARLPAFRRRMREAALWGSGAWVTMFGGMGIASELAIDGGWGTALAIALGGLALPAIPTGVWAWRTRERDRSAAREAEARRRAKQERDELPADVVGDWKRLRRAQVLVEDLAEQGYVDARTLGEQQAMVGELRELLVADRRASDLGAQPSVQLRKQVADVADLLVALAVEAVEHRTAQVGTSSTPATLRDARDRLVSLRLAHAEVDAADRGADHATRLVEQSRREREVPRREQQAPPREREDRRDDEGGTPMATPG